MERRRLQIRQLEECLKIATLESAAEKAESEGDLVAAIAAYEELLALQPPVIVATLPPRPAPCHTRHTPRARHGAVRHEQGAARAGGGAKEFERTTRHGGRDSRRALVR